MKCLRHMALCGLFAGVFVSTQADETGDYLYYRLGVKYKTDGQYDKAIEQFRKVLAEYPDNYNVHMHIAEIRMAQKQPRLAIANLKQALVYNPGWGKAHKMLAEAFENDNQIDRSIGEYQAFQQSCDPAERDSVQRIIDRLIAKIGGSGTQGDPGAKAAAGKPPLPGAAPARQIPSSTETAKTAPAVPENSAAAAAFKQAVDAYEKRDCSAALKAIRQSIAQQPGFGGSYYYAGLIRYELHDSKAARINFAKSRGFTEPTYAGLLCQAKLAAEEKKYGDAVRLLSRYERLTSSQAGRKEAKALRAKYAPLAGVSKTGASEPPAGEKGAEQPAMEVRIDSLLSMVTVDTFSDAGRKLMSGIREFQAGKYDNAVREFKKILAAYPAGPAAVQCMYNCGICYFKLRLLKEAENQFQQILERYPRHELAAKSLFLKALVYSERKETGIAENLFREFLQTRHGHPWEGKAWEKLGDAYIDLDNPGKAVDAYAKAIACAANCADLVSASFKNGSAYATLENYSRAFGCFDSAIAKGERCGVYLRVPDSYYRIADEKYKAKNYPGALEYYTKVTRKYPAFQETAWGLFQIGAIYKNTGKYQQAIETYKDLIHRYPDDYWAKQAQWKLDDAVWEHEYQAALK